MVSFMQIRTILDRNLQKNWYFLEKRVDFQIHPFEVKYCSIRKSFMTQGKRMVPFKGQILLYKKTLKPNNFLFRDRI